MTPFIFHTFSYFIFKGKQQFYQHSNSNSNISFEVSDYAATCETESGRIQGGSARPPTCRGMSGGEHVSLGFFERDDLAAVEAPELALAWRCLWYV